MLTRGELADLEARTNGLQLIDGTIVDASGVFAQAARGPALWEDAREIDRCIKVLKNAGHAHVGRQTIAGAILELQKQLRRYTDTDSEDNPFKVAARHVYMAGCHVREAEAENARLAAELDCAKRKLHETDIFNEWAQHYLDSGKWAGHRYDDAVKQELLARDAEVAALAAECAALRMHAQALLELCLHGGPEQTTPGHVCGPESNCDCLCARAADDAMIMDGAHAALSSPPPRVAAHLAAMALARGLHPPCVNFCSHCANRLEAFRAALAACGEGAR